MDELENLQKQVEEELNKLWAGRRAFAITLAFVVGGYAVVRIGVAIGDLVFGVMNTIMGFSSNPIVNFVALIVFTYGLWRMTQKGPPLP